MIHFSSLKCPFSNIHIYSFAKNTLNPKTKTFTFHHQATNFLGVSNIKPRKLFASLNTVNRFILCKYFEINLNIFHVFEYKLCVEIDSKRLVTVNETCIFYVWKGNYHPFRTTSMQKIVWKGSYYKFRTIYVQRVVRKDIYY